MKRNGADDYERKTERVTRELQTVKKPRSIEWTPDTAEEAVDGLDRLLAEPGATSPRLFQRCGQIVYVTRLEATQERRAGAGLVSRRPEGSLTILAAPRDLISRLAETATTFRVPDRRGKLHSAHAPSELVRRYCASAGLWRVPVLNGISALPLLRPNGEVVTTPGYDSESGYWIEPGATISLPAAPTEDDAAIAIARLGELIDTFPFEIPTDRAVMLAAMLTAVCRHLANQAPAFGFSATTSGTGKTKLAQIVNILQTDRHVAAVISPSRSEEEWRKALFAFALAGESCVLIDNIERPFGSSTLCGAITAAAVQDRRLGASEALSVPFNANVLLTGNNLQIRGDMTRRMLVCRLDAGMEFPEERAFPSDAEVQVRAHRAELVAAALTILAAYLRAGRPLCEPLPSFGSFEQWGRLVRGALVWLGEPDPVQGLRRLREEDPDRETLANLMLAWERRFGTQPTTTAAATSAATSDEVLAQAIKDCCRGDANPTKLGYYLRHIKGRVIGHQRFGSGKKGTTREWTLAKP